MVSLRKSLPRDAQGGLNPDAWLASLRTDHPTLDHQALAVGLALLQRHADQGQLEQGLQIAELVLDLNLDSDAVLAGLCYRAVRNGALDLELVADHLPAEAMELLRAVLRMASVRLLRMSNTRLQTSESGDQITNIRAMVTALIDDARVALIKLAERVVVLRFAKNSARQRQIRIAEESQRIFAPMAGRLGIWHLKWELEDLALRYLDPDAYRKIAGQLDGRRADREAKVAEIVSELRDMLRGGGLSAQVTGRAKHIYSIWRKMQAKQLSFSEVYDVRAVRVLLPNVAECYAALGLIHTRWQHVPSEFDDYIAVPKDNGYRSIHTAVRDDEGQTLEVQLRTQEMHREAELGVAAHWAYKSAGESGSAANNRNAYADKLDWLRQTLSWQDTQAWSEGLADLLDARTSEERVFVYTPAGHVVDLPQGATALDFAYRVHTEVGHSCVGVRVDNKPVALQRHLRSGERIEVDTADVSQPSLHWLDPGLGFVQTTRAREKIQDYWHSAAASLAANTARAAYQQMLLRLGWHEPAEAELARAAAQLAVDSPEALFVAIGRAELRLFELLATLHAQGAGGQIPLLDPVAAGDRTQLSVIGENRDGLLRDVALLLSEQHVPLHSTVASSGDSRNNVSADVPQARILITIETASFTELLRILVLLAGVPGVHSVVLAGE
ncbi:MAG: bifunctional (p)ppGpp synthetase/guanosine-3',5'-bis(diphosphate) 3'-pyrophosphohydrolase [Pseudomonadales bacterium]